MVIKRLMATAASIAFVLGSLLQFSPAFAATVTNPVTQSVSSDSVTGASIALPTMVITETGAGDIPVGVLTWTLPSGFMFDTSFVANVVYSGTNLAGSPLVSFVGTTGFSVTVSATSTVAGSLTVGSVVPLKVKASNGTPVTTPGNVLLTSGMITGLATSTSFGLLTQTPGAPSKLAFTVQPPVNVLVNGSFGTTVGVEDQFGNIITSDNGRNIVLTPNLIASTTSGTLNGTLNTNDSLGLSVFSGLSFNAVNQISLTASASGLASSTSAIINVGSVATPTSTPPSQTCNLRNGILVKVDGSPTVYMVVNCVLRPFNTPAVFHARGKKFTDIVIIDGQVYASLNKGKEIGNGSDDDDTVVEPASSTPPSISGLPEGSVVKLPGNPTVYLVVGGILKPFTSVEVFKAHKKDFKNVRVISSAEFSNLTVGDPVNFPDGTLVKGSNNTVFVVENGQLLGITSMKVLEKHGWSLKNLLRVKDSDLKDLKHGGNKD